MWYLVTCLWFGLQCQCMDGVAPLRGAAWSPAVAEMQRLQWPQWWLVGVLHAEGMMTLNPHIGMAMWLEMLIQHMCTLTVPPVGTLSLFARSAF